MDDKSHSTRSVLFDLSLSNKTFSKEEHVVAGIYFHTKVTLQVELSSSLTD